LLEARLELRDLLSKLDGNDELGGLLANVVGNTEGLKEVRTAATSGTAEAAPAAAAPAAEAPAAAAPEPTPPADA